MARQDYQRQLAELRRDVSAMADLVLERYDDALTAYEEQDEALAEAVITGDHEINQRYLDLEGDCIELFALQQPVAGDLRFIASSFKIITDLERIADLATNIAEYGSDSEHPMSSPNEIHCLGEQAGILVEDAIGAYVAGDAEATWEIAGRDDDLDQACVSVSEAVVRDVLVDDPSNLTELDVEQRLDEVGSTLLAIRDIERVGDHAVNICARTLYMIENDDGLIY